MVENAKKVIEPQALYDPFWEYYDRTRFQYNLLSKEYPEILTGEGDSSLTRKYEME